MRMTTNMDDKTVEEPSTSPKVSCNNLESMEVNGDEFSSLGADKDDVNVISKSIISVEDVSCSCQCGCQKRLEKLENEMKDLISWKTGRQQFDDIITDWKKDIESWMQTTFGFSISESVPVSNDDGIEAVSNENIVTTKDTKTDQENGEEANVVLDEGDTENVEITPDLFGHFLLDNEYDYSDGDNVEDMDESLGEEEEEPEVPIKKLTRRTRGKRNNETDSECYTLSSSSSSEDDTFSEDEYEPQRKRGRGRGRGKYPVNSSVQNKHLKPTSNTDSSVQLSNNSSGNAMADLGSVESKNNLLKHCRKRQGNIWECTVCGFMLTSFDNMLLHIKYNHSSSAHTCPYCRIVVLCRSPKDAVMHQSQCVMRPTNSNDKPLDVKKGPNQSQKVTVAASCNTNDKPKSNNSHKNVDEEVDKFVDDILDSGTTTRATTKNKIVPKGIKKTEEPTVVTLSSDDEDSQDSSSD